VASQQFTEAKKATGKEIGALWPGWFPEAAIQLHLENTLIDSYLEIYNGVVMHPEFYWRRGTVNNKGPPGL